MFLAARASITESEWRTDEHFKGWSFWIALSLVRILLVDSASELSPLFIFQENYGVNDPVAVAKVKGVYAKLDIKSVYHEQEKTSYEKLMKLIDKAPTGLPKEIFTELAAKIYKRDK